MDGICRWGGWGAAALLLFVASATGSWASDHLDTPTVIADPRADIDDLYAWTSVDGRRLNLVMTITGHTFSDRLEYVFHVDSGRRYGKTTATTSIVCRFPGTDTVECRVGDADSARGQLGMAQGIAGEKGHFVMFAGLRDDPFFNNVKGTRAAYQAAIKALKGGTAVDAAGCPAFDHETVAAILDQWRHTDGGPATNFLAGWTPSSIVISVDLKVVAKGGRLLAVWASTSSGERQIDRAGRPLTGNALLGTVGTADVSNALKEQYNSATPETSGQFVAEIEKGLALYDGFDGQCGNQLLARKDAAPSERYHALASLLADDRLWVNTESRVCTQLFAVELSSLAGRKELAHDCGGRTPNYDASNVYRSLLADGTNSSVKDGLERDEHEPSAAVFPFLVAPVPPADPQR